MHSTVNGRPAANAVCRRRFVSAVALLPASEIGTFDTNPKRQRGNALTLSLALRVCVISNRGQSPPTMKTVRTPVTDRRRFGTGPHPVPTSGSKQHLPRAGVADAFPAIRKNRGAAGVGRVSIEMFEANLEQNLDRLMRQHPVRRHPDRSAQRGLGWKHPRSRPTFSHGRCAGRRRDTPTTVGTPQGGVLSPLSKDRPLTASADRGLLR